MNLNLDSFKSSGVYTLEIDNTAMDIQTTDSLRLAVGFTPHAPFNRPVYLAGKPDREKMFGAGYNTKLERRGSFFERSLDILLSSQPVIALNLLNTTPEDKVGVASFALSGNDNKEMHVVDTSVLYDELFDRSRFWIASKDNLTQINYCLATGDKNTIIENLHKGPVFNIANIGTSDFTAFVVKDTNIAGYNITAAKWYENDEIPYEFIRPTDYMSDYFVKLVVVKGDWRNFKQLASDTTYQRYFDASGLIASEVDKFVKADGVSVIGTWSGCIIPNFYAKNGNLVSIEDKVNRYSEQTGVMISINVSAMEAFEKDNNATFGIDMVGHEIVKDTSVNFLSYVEAVADDKFITEIGVESPENYKANEFSVTEDITIALGSFVEDADGDLVKITKKTYEPENGTFKYEAANAVAIFEVDVKDENDEVIGSKSVVRIHNKIESLFTHIKPVCLKGLKLSDRHLPGFDTTGNVNIEAGVEKIYSKLTEDEGINRGLKNRSMINFRYIIDTMAGGCAPGLGGKKHLFVMAKEVGKCSAIVNFPSVQQMTQSSDPIFCDIADASAISKTFSTDYIPMGGNPDAKSTNELTLPTKDEGADYGLVFSPFLRYRNGSRTILLPPAAHVANAYIRKFNGGNPYGTVANRDGVLGDSNVMGVEYMYDSQDRDNLEPTGINPIIDDNGDVMIYGNRTAYQEVLSDLNYAHVRELLNTIEIQCENVLKKYVFKYNNEITRAEIVRRLDPILEEKLNSGALYSYNIICNSDNNTGEIISRAFGIVDIEVQVNKNMEKIIQRIHLNRIEE